MKAIGPVSSSLVEDLLGEDTTTTDDGDDGVSGGEATSDSPSDEL